MYVDDVEDVINLNYPSSSEDYIHRIGRTGRSSSTGTSYAFFTPQNSRKAKDLHNLANLFDDLENTNKILVNDSRGYNLSAIIKKYWKCLEYHEVDIWPVSQNTTINF
ncbi:hypothetical protein HCN44_004949 [Aphidius gifuensis]|uniref:Helicase C-terminal domain-containing protein n=1 Tax=Aphidius gifuensis TaxID=684658 RepID=A0A834XV27_APHGI|nr:hypothetical protein HCN44_004949 [Aphidius gifuensis]